MALRTDGCCCFSLRTGTLILGYLNSTFHSLSAFICILALFHIREMLDSFIESKSLPELSTREYNFVLAAMTSFFGLSLAVSLLVVALSTLLIMGVYQEKEKYIQVNVYAWIAFNILTALSVISQVIFSVSFGKYSEAWSSLIFGSCSIILYIYFTVVIHSYRREIIERRNQGMMLSPTGKQPYDNY